MANGFSQYQQSQLGVSAAKARAISERSQAQFRTGLTAVQEKAALERAADELERIAKEAERKARKRQGKLSLGRLAGQVVGFALGGPAGAAIGSAAGQGLAGGFKSYDVDVPDDLVSEGLFYKRERGNLREQADDLEDAFDDLTKSQRQNIAKNVFTDFLSARAFGKLGETNIKIGDLDVSLDELYESGQISKGEYLKYLSQEAVGGIGEKSMSNLVGKIENVTPIGTAGNLAGAYGNTGLANLDIPQQLLPQPNFDDILSNLRTPQLNAFEQNQNALFNFNTTPMRYIGRNF